IAAIKSDLAAEFEGRDKEIKAAVRSLQKKIVRRRIVEDGIRIDGRGPADIRPLSSEIGLIPTAHGSGLFQRGETQVLSVATLGMPRMEQMLDTIGIDDSKRYMHHYNMAPFATGETGFMRGPKRREIGHGLLAERALLPVVPPIDEFPYTLRVVSDCMSSNGSTSMASVCGSTLSLMDAGVPIKAPVAGIAMGLVFAEGKYTTLTDILGAEDAFGDMDFKVAGTADFVTALQLDTKIAGIPADVLGKALAQAYEARMKVLAVMLECIAEPRPEVNDTAPKIISFEIPMDKIGEVIGPKGKVINAMQQETGADINVDDDGVVGTVTIGAKDGAAVNEARRRIELILDPPRANVGDVYTGKVVNITKFGAFVNILPGRDGLVHISKLGRGKRVERVEDVVSLGDDIVVRVDDVDPQGKVALSPVGEDGEVAPSNGDDRPARAERSDRGDRGDRPERAPREERPAVDSSGREFVSFEEAFDSEAKSKFGDLGPAEVASGGGGGAGDGGGPRRNRDRDRRPGRGGGGGGRR
ncbi:MAG TPA: polyribonucleotide nucleotidyltransferase, partial [Acidimicrobiales bacterium]